MVGGGAQRCLGLASSEPWVAALPLAGCAGLRADPGAESGGLGGSVHLQLLGDAVARGWHLAGRQEPSAREGAGSGDSGDSRVGDEKQRKETRHLPGVEPARPERARRVGRREFILGHFATKLPVPSACFSLGNHAEEKQNHRASETLGKSIPHQCFPPGPACGDLRLSAQRPRGRGWAGATGAGLGVPVCGWEGTASWPVDCAKKHPSLDLEAQEFLLRKL